MNRFNYLFHISGNYLLPISATKKNYNVQKGSRKPNNSTNHIVNIKFRNVREWRQSISRNRGDFNFSVWHEGRLKWEYTVKRRKMRNGKPWREERKMGKSAWHLRSILIPDGYPSMKTWRKWGRNTGRSGDQWGIPCGELLSGCSVSRRRHHFKRGTKKLKLPSRYVLQWPVTESNPYRIVSFISVKEQRLRKQNDDQDFYCHLAGCARCHAYVFHRRIFIIENFDALRLRLWRILCNLDQYFQFEIVAVFLY